MLTEDEIRACETIPKNKNGCLMFAGNMVFIKWDEEIRKVQLVQIEVDRNGALVVKHGAVCVRHFMSDGCLVTYPEVSECYPTLEMAKA